MLNVPVLNSVHPVALVSNSVHLSHHSHANAPGSPSTYQVKGHMHKISVRVEKGEPGNEATHAQGTAAGHGKLCGLIKMEYLCIHTKRVGVCSSNHSIM